MGCSCIIPALYHMPALMGLTFYQGDKTGIQDIRIQNKAEKKSRAKEQAKLLYRDMRKLKSYEFPWVRDPSWNNLIGLD